MTVNWEKGVTGLALLEDAVVTEAGENTNSFSPDTGKGSVEVKVLKMF